MFGIGSLEFVVFLIIVLVVVGPDKLPLFMRTVGKGLREIRRAGRDFRDAVGLDEMMRDDTFRIQPPVFKPTPIERTAKAVPDEENARVDANANNDGTDSTKSAAAETTDLTEPFSGAPATDFAEVETVAAPELSDPAAHKPEAS